MPLRVLRSGTFSCIVHYVRYFKPHLRHLFSLFLGALAAYVVVVWVLVYAEAPRGVLTVAVLDVGQGDAIYIESPTGVQVVVDGGPGSALLRQLPTVMPFFDRSLDALIETHPDLDHIGGFVDVVGRYSVGAFVEPGIPKDTESATVLEQEITDNNIPRYIARRGMTLDLGGGAYIEVLYPDRDVSRLNQNIANEGCVVMRLVYREVSMLLTCDMSAEMEGRVLELEGDELASDILKVAHHGSKYSSSDAFVAAVSPAFAAISVGVNTYGHPAQPTLDTLAAHGVQVLRTDQEGTIVFTSDGESVWQVEK